MSQIDLSSEKESGTKKIKTEVATYDFQTPPNMSPQRSKLLFETSIHSSNIKKQSVLAGKSGIRTPGEMRRSTLLPLEYLHEGLPKVPGERIQINPLISRLAENTMPGNILS
jgi:hypothetical protein